MLFHTHTYNTTETSKTLSGPIIQKMGMNPGAHERCVHVRIRQKIQLKATTVRHVRSESDWDFYLSRMGYM